MHFFLISFLVYLLIVIVSWIPFFGLNRVGIADIIPSIYDSAKKEFSSGHALALFGFAFFIFALLQSKTVQALFSSQKKRLQKKGLLTIAIITIITSLLGSFLGWYDEFIHFYPLVIPLLLSMGFDVFSAVLCLFIGSSAGILGILTSYSEIFQTYGVNQGNTKFLGTDGFSFRLICWVLFTTIAVLFNVWYCNKVRHCPPSPKEENDNELNEKPPVFNSRRTFILFTAIFFVIGSVLGGWGEKVAEKTEPIANKIPSWVSNKYEEEKQQYNELGKVENMGIAEVPEKEEKGYWGPFGSWESIQLASWFTIGAIIICLASRLRIPDVIIETIKNIMPLILAYILMDTVKILVYKSGMGEKIAKLIPEKKWENAKYFYLIGLFVLFFVLNLFISNFTRAITKPMIPLLRPISKSVLLYGVIIMLMARFMGETWSPSNGILQASLKKNNITYKEYIKKTWVLGSIMFSTSLVLILIWTALVVK